MQYAAAIRAVARSNRLQASANLRGRVGLSLPPPKEGCRSQRWRDKENVLAISGKIFRRETKRSNPRVDREKPAPPALGRDARSFRTRAVDAPACRCARVGPPGKCKRFGQLQFARSLGELLRAAYAGRSGWRVPFAAPAGVPLCDKTLHR